MNLAMSDPLYVLWSIGTGVGCALAIIVVFKLIARHEELLLALRMRFLHALRMRSLRNPFDLRDGLLLVGVAIAYCGLRQWSHALANTALGVSMVLFAILTERS